MPFCFLLVLAFVMGCAGFTQAPPAKPKPALNQASSSTPKEEEPKSPWAFVQCNESEEDAGRFLKAIQAFLSSHKDPRTINYINCYHKETSRLSGMWIQGEVLFKEGALFNPSQNSLPLLVDHKSYLLIHIEDSQKQVVFSKKLFASPYTGQIENNQVDLQFSDDKKKVTLKGSVDDKGVFAGLFEFENFLDYQGAYSGLKGPVGRFTIPACLLLKCEKP